MFTSCESEVSVSTSVGCEHQAVFFRALALEDFVPGKSASDAEAVSEGLEVCVQQEAVLVAMARQEN
ncbi:uncharacterized [Tachysurus ichikawai]